MADKIIAMPSDNELYEAFTHALQVAVPENKKSIVKMFDGFISRAKEHLKVIFFASTTGLMLNLTEQTGDQLLTGFVKSQNMLMRLPLKAALLTYGADSFTGFIASTKSGTNNKDATVSGLCAIMSACFTTLGDKYLVAETDETIKTKVAALFADKA